jgi:YidC/Oxa1 family membrane protein insertase
LIGVAWWQALLDGLGWFLSWVYDHIPNYGIAIILLTVGIRLVLLPLGIKQIRSMHAMQALQPKMKALQTKYKGNKQKLNEETMKLYREHGVNPLSGCWPMLLQIPVLAALYSVLQYPQHPPHLPCDPEPTPAEICEEPGALRHNIEQQLYVTGQEEGTAFLGMNLLCSSLEAGQQRERNDPKAIAPDKEVLHLDCGSGIPIRIPYYVLAALMIGTTFYQQKQMQKASPPGASAQQQTLTRVMPLLFGVWGILFPAGLVLYWTTSNLWQIGQQHFILRARRQAEAEPSRGPAKGNGKAAPDGRKATGGSTPTKTPASGTGRRSSSTSKPARRGLFASMLERAERDRARKRGSSKPKTANPGTNQSPPSPPAKPPASGTGSGGRPSAGNRKKRRKR